MKPKDKKEFEALTNLQDRAKWLLKKGVTAKVTINTERLDVVVTAFSAGVALPGEWKSEAEAIAGGTAWLAEKAGLANACVSDGPADAHKSPSGAECPFAARNG